MVVLIFSGFVIPKHIVRLDWGSYPEYFVIPKKSLKYPNIHLSI